MLNNNTTPSTTSLVLKHVSRDYVQGDNIIHALKPIDLEILHGDSLAIVGPSGSGKTTLLSLMAGLDTPTTGEITINGASTRSFDEKSWAEFRAKNIGIVFQQYYLFSYLTALENIALPLQFRKDPDVFKKAEAALDAVEMGHRKNHYPYQMSGGENQRVAIARAFVGEPQIILADEPSGSLDKDTGDRVMNLLFDLIKRKSITLILITHNEALAMKCQRQVRIDK